MPVAIEMDREVVVGRRDLDKGVSLDLGDQKDVVLTKFISTDPLKTCWAPEGVWREQVTTDVGGGRRSVRIGVKREDGSTTSVNVDDGLIIDLEGKMTRLVGLLPGRPPMSQEEVDAYFDQTEKAVPMYQQWDFRVTSVKKTNGPAERIKLGRSEDSKRLGAQTEMFEAFKQMFMMGTTGQLNTGTQTALNVGMKQLAQSEQPAKLFSLEEKKVAAGKAKAEGLRTE